MLALWQDHEMLADHLCLSGADRIELHAQMALFVALFRSILESPYVREDDNIWQDFGGEG